jgi:hypothetical protein
MRHLQDVHDTESCTSPRPFRLTIVWFDALLAQTGSRDFLPMTGACLMADYPCAMLNSGPRTETGVSVLTTAVNFDGEQDSPIDAPGGGTCLPGKAIRRPDQSARVSRITGITRSVFFS